MRLNSDDQLRSYVSQLISQGRRADGFLDLSTQPVAMRIQGSPLARSGAERDVCKSALDKLTRAEKLNRHERHLFEAIVLPTERPAVFVSGNGYERLPSPWQHLNSDLIRRRMATAIQAIGRVDKVIGGQSHHVGSAFVVGPGLMMTNQHVMKAFAEGQGHFMRFRNGLGASIDLNCERGRTKGSGQRVARIVMCHPYWDMALLKVESLGVKPLSLLPSHPDDSVGRTISVVGFPARDYRGNEEAQLVQKRVFGNTFGVKRFQPGYSTGRIEFEDRIGQLKRSVLGHDASTLCGNSGSAVIDVETTEVLGLHFAGRYAEANYAVPSFELSRDSQVRDAGVQFSSGVPEMPNPWKTDWERLSDSVVEQPQVAGRRQRSSTRHEITIDIPVRISVELNPSRQTGNH